MGPPVAAIAAMIPPAGVSRLLIVVVGGLLVLQSTQGLGASKLIYLVVAVVAFGASCRAVWQLRDRPMFDAARPFVIASLVLVGLIALSLPVSVAQGTPTTTWLRDAATYGLLASAPVFALDAAASMRRGLLLGLTVAAGVLGVLSYALYWITLRNLAILPIERLVLPTASLPIALFLVSIGAGIIDRPRRLAWVILGGLALGVLLVTGTRSALFLLVALPVVMVVAGRRLVQRSVTASIGIALVAAVFVGLVQAGFVIAGRDVAPPIDVLPTASPAQSPVGSPGESPGVSPGESPATPSPTVRPPPNPDANLIERLQDFLTSPQRDGSVRERVTQYRVAWGLFVSSPVLGVGLGHPITWTRIDGTVRSDFTADTPLILPAKLGLAGIAWFVLSAFAFVGFVRRLQRAAGVTLPGLAMAGWAATLVALSWAGFILEDKGFSFALMFLLAMGFIEIDRAASVGELSPAQNVAPADPQPGAPA